MADQDKLDVVIDRSIFEPLCVIMDALGHTPASSSFGTLNLSVAEIRDTVHASEKLLTAMGEALEGRSIEDAPAGT